MQDSNSKCLCECGAIVKNLKRHKKTKKHRDLCAASNNFIQGEDEIMKQIREHERTIENCQREIKILRSKLQSQKNPSAVLSDLIEEQRYKEEVGNIWQSSSFGGITRLKSNNVGIVGEKLVREACLHNNINAYINGSRMRTRGGGIGDGRIKEKTVEIKTSHLGRSGTFQHELGEYPWKADYLIFIDITPSNFYLTILPNFSEKDYMCKGFKCVPHFPTKSITRRKGIGNFKFDTSIKLNTKSNATIEIKDNTSMSELGNFIDACIM